MTIETITSGAASTISDLDPTLPAASDPKSEGDNHIRQTKKALQLTFVNVSATVSGVASELSFAHKGGTVSGNAFIKGKIDCGSISVSATAVVNTKLIVADAAIAGSLTVSGTSVFVSPATFEKTVTISHLVAANIVVGRFQSKGTKVAASHDGLTVGYNASGDYTINHPFDTLNYVAMVSLEGSATALVAQVHNLGSTSFDIDVRQIPGGLDTTTAVPSNAGLHVSVHKL